ncbi:hypothetical protein Taro_044146 [Colocasia esculenta]|uniref:Uncharacterized protein n=1 Tax=Colocasia esculenta TaxID=4460 RepID=A0A843X083_COLES|nr:hypothetical protein [Colocasia esculenta]
MGAAVALRLVTRRSASSPFESRRLKALIGSPFPSFWLFLPFPFSSPRRKASLFSDPAVRAWRSGGGSCGAVARRRGSKEEVASSSVVLLSLVGVHAALAGKGLVIPTKPCSRGSPPYSLQSASLLELSGCLCAVLHRRLSTATPGLAVAGVRCRTVVVAVCCAVRCQQCEL